MEFSERWLREWVNPEVNTTVLCDQITRSGLEVESVKKVSDICNGVVIGKVLSCMLHPNSNEWNIISVDIGDGVRKEIKIISKLFNIDKDMKIVVAPVGAILNDRIIIKEINIEGKISQGILCSFFDLGIFEYENDVIILPNDASVGTDVKKYFLLNDNIIKICITPNRFDCQGIIGIARELAIQNNMNLPNTIVQPILSVVKDSLSVILSVPHICPRYLCRIIKNIAQDIQIPIKVKEKLRRSGISTNDTVVDIINYVSLELGLPLHIFDADNISGNIILRMSNENKETAVINGLSVNISENTFLISDDYKILSIGANINTDVAVVTKKTKNLLIGSVFFNNLLNNKKIIHLGEKNYITNCYEYGIDFNLQEYAIEYATNLIIDITGGDVGPLVNKTDNSNISRKNVIKLHRNTINQVLGIFIEDDQILNILRSLGFQVIKDFKYWEIIPPSWRFDVIIEEDVIAEIIRIYGYDKIPVISYRSSMQVNIFNYVENKLKDIKYLLLCKGFYEIITYSFVDPNIQNLLFPDKGKLLLSNPISREMSSMRVSLWPGLLTALSYNQSRQTEHICLFESGLCFIEDKKEDMGVRQNIYLSGIAQGYIYNNKYWDGTDKIIDFYDMKGVVESILEIDGKLKNIDFRKSSLSCLHPGKSASIYYFEKLIGHIGVLHPYLELNFKLSSGILLFEILLNDIFQKNVLKIKNISCFPNSKRDISISVADNVPAGDIINLCKNIDLKKIKEVYIFDLYHGDNIPIGKKSLGIRFVFGDTIKTLEDHDINLIINRCILELKKKFKAIMRN